MGYNVSGVDLQELTAWNPQRSLRLWHSDWGSDACIDIFFGLGVGELARVVLELLMP